MELLWEQIPEGGRSPGEASGHQAGQGPYKCLCHLK